MFNFIQQRFGRKGNWLLLTVCVVVFAACEKVIKLDLSGTTKQYVVEGIVTDHAGGCSVKLSQTKDFYDDNTFVGVSGATVTINDGTTTTTLSEATTGVYTAPLLVGVSGKTYSLEVSLADNSKFTATSTMPALVNMDSLYITQESIFGDLLKQPTVLFQDPAHINNYYRFMIYINGEKAKQTFVRDDELTDGNQTEAAMWVEDKNTDDDRKAVESGDVVQVYMLNIDSSVYKYFFSLESSASGGSGGQSSGTPGNPVSNISGGALGYFSAHTTQDKTITVP